jgi:hypothetical protein
VAVQCRSCIDQKPARVAQHSVVQTTFSDCAGPVDQKTEIVTQHSVDQTPFSGCAGPVDQKIQIRVPHAGTVPSCCNASEGNVYFTGFLAPSFCLCCQQFPRSVFCAGKGGGLV